MSQLVLFDPRKKSESIYYLKKNLTTIGSEQVHDIFVPAECAGVHFTILRQESSFELHPGKAKLKLNGERLSRSTVLRSCDRIEWEGMSAAFVASDAGISPASGAGSKEGPSLRMLQNLTNTLQGCPDFGGAFHQLLDTLIDLSGAEDGLILSDLGETAGWKVVASPRSDKVGPLAGKELFSDTLLNQVLKTREPLFIESIVGNDYANALSVVQAKIFSVACIPLIVGERIFGAVFLHTHSPGKHIQRSMLPELRVLATQAALMLISANEIKTQQKENTGLKRRVATSESSFIYQHSSMEEVVKTISRLAPSTLNVLIAGETGTGKEIAAKEIHRLSTRKNQPFVAINCAAIPATLLESTLFGYEKGAFTGADRAQPGKFEQANGGTIFLDEIGDLPLELQAKLLRVLQERVVDPLGSTRSRPVDVRVIVATHRDLDTMIAKGEFRQDFYFRIAGAKIRLPALRERDNDLLLIARHLLKQAAPERTFSEEAEKKLKSHAWPGNVRELEHVIARAAILADGPVLSAADVGIEKWVSSIELGASTTLDQAQTRFTQKFVQGALEKNQGNRAITAKALGISERTLYRILAESTEDSAVPGR